MNYTVCDHEVTARDESGRVLARVTFPFTADGLVDINHTMVDECLRGQGTASCLLEKAAEKIRQEGWKTRHSCSYAEKWFAKHPEYQDILES